MKDTHDADFVRDYAVSVDRLWKAVTRSEELIQWFGPEGLRIECCEMDFTRTGPWVCEMRGLESGKLFKVSGVVTRIDLPKHGAKGVVGFTWAWHDENDRRGHESTVRFEVRPDGKGGTLFSLIHSGLADEDAARNHEMGWTSSLRKLERLAA